MPSVAGILYEAYLNADASLFNFTAKGAEALGYGKPGINIRKEAQYDEYGGVYGNKIVERPEGSWGETALETLGDALALTPIGGESKGMSSPVLMAKQPGVKAGVIKSLKEQAANLVPLNGGKARATLRSESKQLEIDLTGADHNGIATPHTKTSPRIINAPGSERRYNTSAKKSNTEASS